MKAIVVFSMFVIPAHVIDMALMAGELACNAESSSSTPACCPKCGCCTGLIPVCQPYCTTKKETRYRYCCQCKPICILDRGQLCDGTECGGPKWYRSLIGCGASNCNCFIKEQYQLVKVPYTVETPVWKCRIGWVCPHCGCNCSGEIAKAASTKGRGELFPAPQLVSPKLAPEIATNPAASSVTSASEDDGALTTAK